jgi:hypothetical protein
MAIYQAVFINAQVVIGRVSKKCCPQRALVQKMISSAAMAGLPSVETTSHHQDVIGHTGH